jgi:hypothetical protein
MALVAVLGGLLVGMVAATPLLFADTVGAGAAQRQWDRACPEDVKPHVEGAGMRALFGADDALLARMVGGLAAFGPVDVVAESGAMTFRNKATIRPGPGGAAPATARIEPHRLSISARCSSIVRPSAARRALSINAYCTTGVTSPARISASVTISPTGRRRSSGSPPTTSSDRATPARRAMAARAAASPPTISTARAAPW